MCNSDREIPRAKVDGRFSTFLLVSALGRPVLSSTNDRFGPELELAPVASATRKSG